MKHGVLYNSRRYTAKTANILVYFLVDNFVGLRNFAFLQRNSWFQQKFHLTVRRRLIVVAGSWVSSVEGNLQARLVWLTAFHQNLFETCWLWAASGSFLSMHKNFPAFLHYHPILEKILEDNIRSLGESETSPVGLRSKFRPDNSSLETKLWNAVSLERILVNTWDGKVKKWDYL